MSNVRNKYIAKTRKNLDLLNARLIELEARAREKKGEVSRELNASLESVREMKSQAERQLEELRLASEPAWEDVKRGAEQAYRSFSKALEQASGRFQ